MEVQTFEFSFYHNGTSEYNDNLDSDKDIYSDSTNELEYTLLFDCILQN